MKAEIVSLEDARKQRLKPSPQDEILLANCDQSPWYVINRLLAAAQYETMEQDDMVKRIRQLKGDHQWKPITSLQCGELVES